MADIIRKYKMAFMIALCTISLIAPSLSRAAAPIPNVMNMTTAQAQETLKKAGYEAVITEIPVTDSSKDGKVVSYSPMQIKGVVRVPVTVGVFGIGRTVNGIPNTIGMEEKAALDTLKKAGYEIVVTYEKPSSSSYIGRVTNFTSNIPRGTKRIGVTVGTTPPAPPAPPPVLVVVPNFVGKDRWSLGPQNGLTVEVKGLRGTGIKAEENKVLAQDPPPGAKVLSNTKVMITLGNYTPSLDMQGTVPKVLEMSHSDAVRALNTAGFGSLGSTTKETAWQEQDGKVLEQDPSPGTTVDKKTVMRIKVGKYTASALDVRAVPIPDSKTYLLMIKGGAQPYDVRASYEIPKSAYVAGTKYCEIVPLKESPPGWVSYRVYPRADMTARFTITDAKGVKHQYDVMMKKDAK